MTTNAVKELKAYFSTEEKPVSAAEMMDFWKSLSDEEKKYYQEVDLSQV